MSAFTIKFFNLFEMFIQFEHYIIFKTIHPARANNLFSPNPVLFLIFQIINPV